MCKVWLLKNHTSNITFQNFKNLFPQKFPKIKNNNRKEEKNINKKINSVQQWLQIKEFYKDGVLKLKNNNFIKIIKINPINYELKSEFEKKSILNSYKAFLKNINFDIQIIIKSNKEDITENIKKIEKQKEKEKILNNKFILNVFDSYINFIKNKNKEKLSSSKEFYIVINSKKYPENNQENILLDLKEKYFKIKDSLARCGNSVFEIKDEKEIKNIICSFLKFK